MSAVLSSDRQASVRDPAEPSVRVAYLVRSWPRLSQTFVLGEVLAVERAGAAVTVLAMTRAREAVVQPQVAEVQAAVSYLDEHRPGRGARLAEHAAAFLRSPVGYLHAALLALLRPGLSAGYATANTRQCLGFALTVATALRRSARAGKPVGHLHAHFAHDPALVALLTHHLTGISYSFTGHARDLHQIPAAALAARAAHARAVITCCPSNAEYVRAAMPGVPAERVQVAVHGVDLDRFRPIDRSARTGMPTVISIGRLVEKKGLPDLLGACAELVEQGVRFRIDIYGDGPLLPALIADRDRLGLGGAVSFRGECAQDALLPALAAADVFALTPFVTADGDRDGIPNVLVEAMACGLPVLGTSAGGLGDLIRDDLNGLLAEPRDIADIAAKLRLLLTDPALRRRLGAAGRQTVQDEYDVRAAARTLMTVFEATP